MSHNVQISVLTVLKRPPQSPDLSPKEQLCDVVEREIHITSVQLTNLQLLCDVVVSIWTKMCFRHLVESVQRRIKAAVPNKVESHC